MDQLCTYMLVILLLALATTLYAGDAKLVPSVNSPNIIRIVDETIFLVSFNFAGILRQGKCYIYFC